MPCRGIAVQEPTTQNKKTTLTQTPSWAGGKGKCPERVFEPLLIAYSVCFQNYGTELLGRLYLHIPISWKPTRVGSLTLTRLVIMTPSFNRIWHLAFFSPKNWETLLVENLFEFKQPRCIMILGMSLDVCAFWPRRHWTSHRKNPIKSRWRYVSGFSVLLQLGIHSKKTFN